MNGETRVSETQREVELGRDSESLGVKTKRGQRQKTGVGHQHVSSAEYKGQGTLGGPDRTQ